MILWDLVKNWQAYCCTDKGGLKINNNLPGICCLALFSTISNSTRQSRQLWNCPSVSTADKSCHTKGADFPSFIHFSRWCFSWNRDGTIVRWKGQSSMAEAMVRICWLPMQWQYFFSAMILMQVENLKSLKRTIIFLLPALKLFKIHFSSSSPVSRMSVSHSTCQLGNLTNPFSQGVRGMLTCWLLDQQPLQLISTVLECTIQPLSPFSQTVPAHSMYLCVCKF